MRCRVSCIRGKRLSCCTIPLAQKHFLEGSTKGQDPCSQPRHPVGETELGRLGEGFWLEVGVQPQPA